MPVLRVKNHREVHHYIEGFISAEAADLMSRVIASQMLRGQQVMISLPDKAEDLIFLPPSKREREKERKRFWAGQRKPKK